MLKYTLMEIHILIWCYNLLDNVNRCGFIWTQNLRNLLSQNTVLWSYWKRWRRELAWIAREESCEFGWKEDGIRPKCGYESGHLVDLNAGHLFTRENGGKRLFWNVMWWVFVVSERRLYSVHVPGRRSLDQYRCVPHGSASVQLQLTFSFCMEYSNYYKWNIEIRFEHKWMNMCSGFRRSGKYYIINYNNI